jgi:RNA polymerase sigma factor (sigma-70 family)
VLPGTCHGSADPDISSVCLSLPTRRGRIVRDVAEFEAFYAAHRRHVVAYCLRRTSRPEAYEAADEALLIAWRRFEDIPRGLERAWLYGVAHRVLSNQYRSERRRRRLDAKLAQSPAEPFAGPEAQAVRTDEQERLLRAYLRLSPADQEVLRLACWEGLAHDEVALALGCEVGAARQKLHRARTRLAQQVQRSERRALAITRRSDDG